MAQQPNNAVNAWGVRPPIGPIRTTDTAVPPDLPLFRFGLRHLLFSVAGISTLLAAVVSLDGIPALAVLLAALVVAFHVLSTALGSRLRRHANRHKAGETGGVDPAPPGAGARIAPAHRVEFQPCCPWYGRTNSFAWLPRVVAIAVLLGGFLGAFYLIATIGHRTSLAGLVVGAISVAALSGWFAFLGGSFVAIVRGGLSEAVEEQDSQEARRSVPG
jgi:hypothetical protein